MHYNNHESLAHEPIERLQKTERYFLAPRRELGISPYQNNQFNKPSQLYFPSLSIYWKAFLFFVCLLISPSKTFQHWIIRFSIHSRSIATLQHFRHWMVQSFLRRWLLAVEMDITRVVSFFGMYEHSSRPNRKCIRNSSISHRLLMWS